MTSGSRQPFGIGSRLTKLFKRNDSSPSQGAGLEEASALKQQGRLDDARTLCLQVLSKQPDDIEVCLLLAEIDVAQGDRDHAMELYSKVIELRPDQALAYYKRGNLLRDRDQLEPALADYDRAITLNPRYAYALCNRGVVLTRLNRQKAALESYDQALAISPDDALAWFNRADVLLQLKQPVDALVSFDRAISIRPDYLEAYFNRAILLQEQRKLTDALASFDKVLALKSDYLPAHFKRALLLLELRRPAEALANLNEAVALNPNYVEAHYNRGLLLVELRKPREALASFDRVVALLPAFADVHVSRANLLVELGQFTDALLSFDRALALKPGDPDTRLDRASALLKMKRFVEAMGEYERVTAVKPDARFALGSLVFCKLQICDWGGLDADIERLVAGVRAGAPVVSMLHILAAVDDESLHHQAAQIWLRVEGAVLQDVPPMNVRTPSDKLRIGYFSSDFYEHPVALLAVELFERHDRSRFEITAFSLRPKTPSLFRQRLESAFDRFLDVSDTPPHEIALLARRYGIDIAVDLNGYTDGARLGIWAHRAAPIQITYLGYPGTLGASYYDYLIADPTVIPSEHQSHYSEKIVYLPHSYLPNDSKREIDVTPTREREDLPVDRFVFCCFNNTYKITPEVFSSWMRILARIDHSVLWLSSLTDVTAVENLRREAQKRGIDPGRLIFAQRVQSPSKHLARLKLADLFLDTLPYNAHATSIDALWAGVPVLTRIGRSFAGRVAASVLRTFGLPELVTTSLQQYEDRAVELATNPALLAEIKQRLADNRSTTPLFDSDLFARNMESAYAMIFERHRAGLRPDHMHVQGS